MVTGLLNGTAWMSYHNGGRKCPGRASCLFPCGLPGLAAWIGAAFVGELRGHTKLNQNWTHQLSRSHRQIRICRQSEVCRRLD